HQTGKSTIEVIFTVLHAGGKFGQGGYKTSGGLHGVGASVVNALSEWLSVTVFRNGEQHTQKFKNGGKEPGPLEYVGKTKKQVSVIRFKPDSNVFSNVNFDFDILSERLQEAAFLLKGLTITLCDERRDIKEEYL